MKEYRPIKYKKKEKKSIDMTYIIIIQFDEYVILQTNNSVPIYNKRWNKPNVLNSAQLS